MNASFSHTSAPAQTCSVRKLVLTAMFACLAFVLSSFVYFPNMAPFQHFINVLAAVFVGPYYALAAAFLAGLLRMMCGRSIQAVVGAVFGALLAGLLYRKTQKLWAAVVGEVFGTGFLSAMAAYPLMRLFYGLDAQSPFFYIPLYAPSAALGAFLAVGVLGILKRSGRLERMRSSLNRPQGGSHV